CAEAYPTAANTSRLRRGEPANDARHRRLEASVGDSVGRGDVFLEAGLGVGGFAFELPHHLEPVALRLLLRALGGSAHAFFRFSPCVGESVGGGRFGILDTTPCVDLGVDQTTQRLLDHRTGSRHAPTVAVAGVGVPVLDVPCWMENTTTPGGWEWSAHG